MRATKSIQSIEAEEQALLAELTGIENAIKEMHDREHTIRTELQHIEIHKHRMTDLQQ